jgi:hypothetical protein
MFFDQKKQIQTLTAKLEQAMRDNKNFEEKTSRLEQVCSTLLSTTHIPCLACSRALISGVKKETRVNFPLIG